MGCARLYTAPHEPDQKTKVPDDGTVTVIAFHCARNPQLDRVSPFFGDVQRRSPTSWGEPWPLDVSPARAAGQGQHAKGDRVAVCHCVRSGGSGGQADR